MPRIKVTGYIDTEDLPSSFVDLTDRTGLTGTGYEAITGDVGDVYEWKVGNLDNYTLELER